MMNDTHNQCVLRYLLVLVFSALVVMPAAASHRGLSSPSELKQGFQWQQAEREQNWEAIYPALAYELFELADKGGESKGYGNHRKRYEDLTPEQREKLRKRRDDFRSLPPEERERIRNAREKFRKMSPEKRQELKDKWKKMTPEERKQRHRKKDKKRYD